MTRRRRLCNIVTKMEVECLGRMDVDVAKEEGEGEGRRSEGEVGLTEG